MKKAVYPGSFDPITNGHCDLISRGAALFDELVVAVAGNESKSPVFSLDERLALLRAAAAEFPNVTVDSFSGLTVTYCRAIGASAILRGIRTVSDFEYEFQMALTNREFAAEIETVFVMASLEHSFISSRLLREAAAAGGDVTPFVPSGVAEQLLAKLDQPNHDG